HVRAIWRRRSPTLAKTPPLRHGGTVPGGWLTFRVWMLRRGGALRHREGNLVGGLDELRRLLLHLLKRRQRVPEAALRGAVLAERALDAIGVAIAHHLERLAGERGRVVTHGQADGRIDVVAALRAREEP